MRAGAAIKNSFRVIPQTLALTLANVGCHSSFFSSLSKAALSSKRQGFFNWPEGKDCQHRIPKSSFLNQKTYDYLDTAVSVPVAVAVQKDASIKTSQSPMPRPQGYDVIYQYLKTFSIFNKRKNGILIKYNQHIGYNFNSKNILLRGSGSGTGCGCSCASAGLPATQPLAKAAKAAKAEKGYQSGCNCGLTVNNRTAYNRLIKYSYKLLFYFFKSVYCLISKPVFLFTPDKVTIQLFYYLNVPKFKVFKWYYILNNNAAASVNSRHVHTGSMPRKVKKTLIRLNKKRNKIKNTLFNLNKFNLFKVFTMKFKLICEILSNKFKKPVELQLIRIHHPYHDSNILVNFLSLNIRNKKFKPLIAIEKLYAKKVVKNLYDYSINSINSIPTFLSGINIRIGGRLMREPIIPRITTKKFERGASSPGKVNFLDTATITKKNRKGSYTINISSGQNFF